MLTLARQGVFWTIQGEGYLAGEPSIFIRLSGCSVGCPGCDTNYQYFATVDEQHIVDQCKALRDQNRRAEYVWVTGGEPTDQDLGRLNDLLRSEGFKACLATSGIRKTDLIWWWISVSPHGPRFEQRAGSEIKLVPELNGLSLKDIDLTGCQFAHRWVQPMAGSRSSLEACCEWLKDHPLFRMSPQSHKSWGLP